MEEDNHQLEEEDLHLEEDLEVSRQQEEVQQPEVDLHPEEHLVVSQLAEEHQEVSLLAEEPQLDNQLEELQLVAEEHQQASQLEEVPQQVGEHLLDNLQEEEHQLGSQLPEVLLLEGELQLEEEDHLKVNELARRDQTRERQLGLLGARELGEGRREQPDDAVAQPRLAGEDERVVGDARDGRLGPETVVLACASGPHSRWARIRHRVRGPLW